MHGVGVDVVVACPHWTDDVVARDWHAPTPDSIATAGIDSGMCSVMYRVCQIDGRRGLVLFCN